MKDDRQFLDSIYKKHGAKRAACKRITAISLAAVLMLALISGAALFLINGQDNGKEQFKNESVIITSPSESAEGEVIKDKPLEELVLLSCPIKVPSEEVTTTPVNDELTIITFPEGTLKDGYRSPYTTEFTPDDNYKLFVAIEVNPLTVFSYQGTPLSEIFKPAEHGYGYYFKDGNYIDFNKFLKDFYTWDLKNGAETLKKELEEKARNGDTYAAETLQEYKDADNETLFYALVWSKGKSEETISELNRQRTEFNRIWKLYEENGKDILLTHYKEEIEVLISEGYDLYFVTVDGEVKLVGALSAEQAEYFNRDVRFGFSTVWVKASYEDKYCLQFPFSDKIIEVPKRNKKI